MICTQRQRWRRHNEKLRKLHWAKKSLNEMCTHNLVIFSVDSNFTKFSLVRFLNLPFSFSATTWNVIWREKQKWEKEFHRRIKSSICSTSRTWINRKLFGVKQSTHYLNQFQFNDAWKLRLVALIDWFRMDELKKNPMTFMFLDFASFCFPLIHRKQKTRRIFDRDRAKKERKKAQHKTNMHSIDQLRSSY